MAMIESSSETIILSVIRPLCVNAVEVIGNLPTCITGGSPYTWELRA